MADITGIGANVYDTLIKLAEFPTEDTKVCVETVVTSGGGPTGTGLVAAAKLGASCSIVAVLSTDTGGQFLMSDYAKYGIKTDFVDVRDGESFSATVLLSSATGSRTCLLNRGTLPKLELNDAQIAEILGSKVFMVDGNELEATTRVAEMIRKNRKNGNSVTKILYDAGGRYPGVEKLLPLVDILIPSAEFARGFTGKETLEEAVCELFAQFRPEIVVITDGARGGILFDGTEIRTYPAFPVTVIDSNGAGDVFHGAFAFAVTQGWDYYRCCVFSSAVSALKCTKIGARPGVPSYEETLAFLKAYGIK